jgi:hypothetical protein
MKSKHKVSFSGKTERTEVTACDAHVTNHRGMKITWTGRDGKREGEQRKRKRKRKRKRERETVRSDWLPLGNQLCLSLRSNKYTERKCSFHSGPSIICHLHV